VDFDLHMTQWRSIWSDHLGLCFPYVSSCSSRIIARLTPFSESSLSLETTLTYVSASIRDCSFFRRSTSARRSRFLVRSLFNWCFDDFSLLPIFVGLGFFPHTDVFLDTWIDDGGVFSGEYCRASSIEELLLISVSSVLSAISKDPKRKFNFY